MPLPVLFSKKRFLLGAGALVALASLSPAFAQQADTPPAPPAMTAPIVAPIAFYTQDLKAADGTTQAVQTAIRRFDPVSGSGPTVYLVAAVHIGEKDYYRQLNTFLGKEDVVLYEGVKGTRVAAPANPAPLTSPAKPAATPPANTKTAPVAAPVSIQKKLSDVLNLQFQLEGINYKQPNFRNSDLTWQQMEALADKSGAGTKKNLTELGSTLSGGPNSGTTGAMFDTLLGQAKANPAVAKMLRAAIVQLVANPAKIAEIQKQQGADQASMQTILIAERNKVVLADLKSLTDPAKTNPLKPVHSVAIFFGAEHMRDMEQHLVSDLGYRAADTKWLTAINVAPQGK